ncbi:hypothetical protein Tco_0888684 [Tanacetum coccineum]
MTQESSRIYEPELSKTLSTYDFSSSLPTELKELPSKFIELTREVKELKKHVYDLEIELPGDLKEIPTKLENFTSTFKSLTTQVAELKTLHLLNRVTEALNKFAQVIESASTKGGDKVPQRAPLNLRGSISRKTRAKRKDVEEECSESDSHDTIYLTSSMVEPSKKKKWKKFDFITKGGDHVHLIEEQIKEQKRIEESTKAEAAKHEVKVRREDLVDLLGPDVVSNCYKSKLQYEKYCDKMLNRRAKSRITNCDVLTRKGPITLKVYREDGTDKVIPNFKASDLHLAEWNETRTDYLYQTEAELGIDLNKPLSDQDPLDKLNELAKKERKHADGIHNYFRADKRLKSSVQYKDHLARSVLNEPVLGMIMFNSYHRQDFVTIEDFGDFSNEMMSTIQEIFFRLHQGLRLDDHARTFSSLLLAKVDKRNLNPLK